MKQSKGINGDLIWEQDKSQQDHVGPEHTLRKHAYIVLTHLNLTYI